MSVSARAYQPFLLQARGQAARLGPGQAQLGQAQQRAALASRHARLEAVVTLPARCATAHSRSPCG